MLDHSLVVKSDFKSIETILSSIRATNKIENRDFLDFWFFGNFRFEKSSKIENLKKFKKFQNILRTVVRYCSNYEKYDQNQK